MDARARALGIAPGMTLARAEAMLPGLIVLPAQPAEEQAALARLAAWCLRYAPLTASCPPDGVWIDATGATDLAGGEAALLGDLRTRLQSQGFAARAAVADTPGAAYAMARYAPTGADLIVPPGGQREALAPLPVAALRLPPDVREGLARLGFDTIGPVQAAARAPMVRRFGAVLAQRLDQALGHVFEPLRPVLPPALISERRAFADPLRTAEAFSAVIAHLCAALCRRLARAGLGARQLDLLFERLDGSVASLRIGTARPSQAPRPLGRMLDERLARIDPGAGVEAMRLTAVLAEPFAYAQTSYGLAAEPEADLAPLVDRLSNRLGPGRVYRLAPVESDVPERGVRAVPALAAPGRRSWPEGRFRPARLLSPPQPVAALAPLPDQPPLAFTWRRQRIRIRRADGPERIFGEWWRHGAEARAVRDYFRVEAEDGRRYWLFRRGDGIDHATGNLSWFLHGLF